ncbi:MAG: hypothetical protein AAFX06_05975 [Planctomycetota bacterium]
MSESRPTEAISVAATADDLRSLQRNWLSVIAFFIATALLALFASTAAGQAPKYEVLKLNPQIDNPTAAKQMSREAALYTLASDLAAVPQRRAKFAEVFFLQYVPAKLTQPDSVHEVSELMNQANTLLSRAVRSRRPSAGKILRWMYAGLKPIAVGNYQPTARINAIQFISKLAKPAAKSGMPPVPYPFVATDLMPIYADASAPEGVRAAALHGLERFVRYSENVDPALKTQLTTEMKKLLDEEAPAGRDSMVHAFLQRYAVSILTNLNSEPTLGTQLVSVSTDEKKPDLIALHSAASLGTLQTKLKPEDVKTEEVLKQWTERVLKSFESEAARLDALSNKTGANGVTQPSPPDSWVSKKKQDEDEGKAQTASAAGMEGMMGMGTMDMGGAGDMDMEMGMMGGMEMMGGSMGGLGGLGGVTKKVKQPAEVVASRKKLNYTIQSLWLGVTGTSKPVEDLTELKPEGGIMVATAPKKMEAVNKWLETINEVATAINDTSVGETNSYRKIVGDQLEVLKDYLEGKSDEIKPDGDFPDFEDPLVGFSGR